MAFDGLRILSLESRRAMEMDRLIRNQGGDPFVAPSVREVPVEQNPAAFAFMERLLVGEFDTVILLTGVGTKYLSQVIETRWPAGAVIEALKKVQVVVRGPKPAAVMREWGVPIAIIVPEPNTWREIMAATDGKIGRRVAIQEFGRPSDDLVRGLEARGAEVTSVPVYQWDLPENTEPLKEAARRLALGNIDVVLFTASVQVENLFRVADQIGLNEAARRGMARAVVASIGPTTTETLREMNLRVDFEPSHPKMGILLNELAREAGKLLEQKRGAVTHMSSNEINPNRKFAFRAARYTSLAMALPATVVAGYFIGYALDAWLHTTYLKVVFLILGVVGGMTQLIQLISRDMHRDKTK